MVRLKNRRNCPINGFQYRQPETGAEFKDWDFETTVNQVIAHRKQNPRFSLNTDPGTVREEVDHANALRMLAIAGAENFIITDSVDGGGPDPKARASRSVWQSAVGGAKKLAAGANVLHDWLGAGGQAVPAPLSAARGETCSRCPKNGKGDWTRFFTEPASQQIKRKLAIKNDLAMATPYDAQLGVCEACLCPLPLKVHTPLEHILKHMSGEVRAALDAGCWVLSEASNA